CPAESRVYNPPISICTSPGGTMYVLSVTSGRSGSMPSSDCPNAGDGRTTSTSQSESSRGHRQFLTGDILSLNNQKHKKVRNATSPGRAQREVWMQPGLRW